MMEVPSDLQPRQSQFTSQVSSLQTHLQQAVCVRNGCKRYGFKNKPVVVLDGLNMTVPKGAIYGLLGASGCGKTTILNCIIGRRVLDSGEIWVLGGTPGSRGSGVPGPRVGYMPQETALYGEFTIRETFKYFGWISGMTTQAIEERLTFLANLFMLPDVEQLVQNLSGGQQRRVSLATALLPDPELLILDEPTVGLDPVLRQTIWDYFTEITKHGKTTVIITTHYIEETRQAHLIALMRGGYLLAEESPDNLLTKFGCDRLETAFLKLSIFQSMGNRDPGNISEKVTEATEEPTGFINEAVVLDDTVEEITGEFGDNVTTTSKRRMSLMPVENTPLELPLDQEASKKFSDYFPVVKSNHLFALMWKNFLWMWRNLHFTAFLLWLPVLQTVLFCLAIGHDPKGLQVSVVNYELEDAETCKTAPGCNSTRLSCNYLDNLQERTVKLIFYSSEEEAKDSVRSGDTWATLVFASNFSDAIRNRVNKGQRLRDWDIVASSVDVYQDRSNENIAALLYRQLYFGLEDFIKAHLTACGIDSKVGTIPIQWKKPVYGTYSTDFTDFVAPGIILSLIFFLAMGSTAASILLDRTEGMLERCLVSGITGIEFLISIAVTQFLIMVCQSLLVILFTKLLNIPYNGDLICALLLIVFTGLCGMCYGFAIGSFCADYYIATYLSIGSMFTILFLCGMIWPVEGMSNILRPISYILPLTKSTESLRSIMIRGLGISMPVVYEGFIATFIWTVIFVTSSTFLLKFKKG